MGFCIELSILIYFSFFISTFYSDESNLLLFVAITSGPDLRKLRNAARKTWLTQCKCLDIEFDCDCYYKFFVDKIVKTSTGPNQTSLLNEYGKYKDLVFREDCPFMMKRHPLESVHYGQWPPYTGIHNYPLRRMVSQFFPIIYQN